MPNLASFSRGRGSASNESSSPVISLKMADSVTAASRQEPLRHMEGFGNTYVMSSLSYGSVADGTLYQPTFEQKVKKTYWKTKQAMIQKLGKSQDEFVVAGDAEIDTKLEKAYHLESSCAQVLDALEQYGTHVKALSASELNMGEYLTAYSEEEPTQASSVMKAVGVAQEKVAKQRMAMLPSLVRLHNEFVSFMNNAISDLDLSIERLESARTEYRAALLWMRDASTKLQDPDHRNELFKFRQVQAQVKDTKALFERLKVDLGEKIDMVAASRCNLISCSLPGYQKELLTFLDHSASQYHLVLEKLRAYNQNQHQYQESRLLEEIRDLEVSEPPLDGSQIPAGGGQPGHTSKPESNDDDKLIDISSSRAPDQSDRPLKQQQQGKMAEEHGGTQLDATSSTISELKDLLRMDEELLQVDGYGCNTDDLLGMLDDSGRGGAKHANADQSSFDEWGNFSSFTDDVVEETSAASEWVEEFAGGGTGGGSSQQVYHGNVDTFELLPAPTLPPPASSPILPLVSSMAAQEPKKMQDASLGLEEFTPSSLASPASKNGPTQPLKEPSPLPSTPASPPTTQSQSIPVQNLLEIDVLSVPSGLKAAGSSIQQDLAGLDLTAPTATSSSLPEPLMPTNTSGPLPPVAMNASSGPLPPVALNASQHSPMINPLLGQRQPTVFGTIATGVPCTTGVGQGGMATGNAGYMATMPQNWLNNSGSSLYPTFGAMTLKTAMFAPQQKPLVATSTPSTNAGPKGAGKEQKGTSWMNVFANLDPLVNEKA